MSYFLVIYDRHRQLKPVIERVTDSAGAQERLFEIEEPSLVTTLTAGSFFSSRTAKTTSARPTVSISSASMT
jgi:hypothetical protein